MITGIVSEHQGRHIEFPVGSGVVHEGSQIFGDGFIANLSLTVALRVIS